MIGVLVLVALGWLLRPGRLDGQRVILGRARTAQPDETVLLELLGFMRLTARSAMSARQGLDLAAARGSRQLRDALKVHRSASASAADVLAAMGQPTGALDALALSVRYGLPIDAVAERLEGELAERRRRVLETRIRQLPVRLLFPLVLCVLPAFVLVGVVPVVVAAWT